MSRHQYEDLLEERRKLLAYLLEAHVLRGGKAFLPIGMTNAEPWLLDALDSGKLLGEMRSRPQGTIELLHCCGVGSAPGSASPALALQMEAAVAAGGGGGDGGGDGGDGGAEEPQLQLAQLQTGLTEAEVQDLAYLVFTANCRDASESEVLRTVRSQLGVDEKRAAEMDRLLRVVAIKLDSVRVETGHVPVDDNWRGTVQLCCALLGAVRPRDFSRFKSFVVWRTTLSHVLVCSLTQSCRDGWAPPLPAAGAVPSRGSNDDGGRNGNDAAHGSGGSRAGAPPTAQQLLARLRAALRRCDVRDADDFDSEEYLVAVRSVGSIAGEIARCTSAGWHFPWGLRVRLAEVLLRGVFDVMEDATYVAEADAYLQLLQERVWPVLGVSPAMHNAGFAWAHFRQYICSHDAQLVARTKALLRRLGRLADKVAGSSGTNTSSCSPEDAVLVNELGRYCRDWILERLSDYHACAPRLGGVCALPGLAELMLSAARSCQAAEPGDELQLLVDAIGSSMTKEFERRLAAAGPFHSAADELLAAALVVRELAVEEAGPLVASSTAQRRHRRSNTHDARGGGAGTGGAGAGGGALALSPLLAPAPAVALARLHLLYGQRFLPFLGSIRVLDDKTLQVVKAAIDLEPLLLHPVSTAATGSAAPRAARAALAAAHPYETCAQLAGPLSSWVAAQLQGFASWVARAIEREDWRPLGAQQPHGNSAREVRRIVVESLDALFGLGVPVPAEVLSMHLEGVDGVLDRYVHHVVSSLGPWQRLVPPAPPLTRYKQETSVEAEATEQGLPGLPAHLPPLQIARRAGVVESVPRIEEEPFFDAMATLTTESLAVRLSSLSYLLATLGPLVESVQARWSAAEAATQQLCSVSSGSIGSSGGGAPGAISGSHRRSASAGIPDGLGGLGFSPAGSSRVQELLGSTLEGVAQSLRNAAAQLTKFMAVKIVWWDMREGWCELLYRHRAARSLGDRLVQQLGAALLSLNTRLSPDQHLAVARALLHEVAAALERALLDGGPTRLYVPQDVELIRADVAALRRLFWAEGDGVPAAEVDAALCRALALLRLMEASTGDLIQMHKAAARHVGGGGGGGAAGLQQQRRQRSQPRLGGGGGAGEGVAGLSGDEGVLLRLLCHRADHAASKHLKDAMELPKAKVVRKETITEKATRLARLTRQLTGGR